MEHFAKKIAIVTGGASGIGRAVGEELARRGACVILADRNSKMLEEAAGSFVKAGGHAKAVVLDVTDPQAVKKLVHDAASEFGQLDYIFNNAGVVVFGEARDFSYDDWRKVIDTNLYGVVNGVAAAYPLMIRQGFGHIVNTASAAGLVPVGGLASYVASKYGVVGLSNALRMEGAEFGVKVSVICPGLIDTPMKNSKTANLDGGKLLAMSPPLLPVEKCARTILRGVEVNKAFILVTPLAKIFWLLHRISPVLTMRILASQMKKLHEMRLDRDVNATL